MTSNSVPEKLASGFDLSASQKKDDPGHGSKTGRGDRDQARPKKLNARENQESKMRWSRATFTGPWELDPDRRSRTETTTPRNFS